MMQWRKPVSKHKGGEDHLRDEEAMRAIELEMLHNIHKEIFGRWHFIRTSAAKYTMAASVLLMCCSALFYKKLTAGNESEWLVVSTKKGNIKTIQLPDGSTVWLNSGSAIKFPEHFAKTREIELINGEAYFDVKHNDQSPFIVHYGSLHARVLGTAFNVKFYKNINDVRLSVTRGRVEVGNKAKSFGVLTLDKEIIYDQKVNTHLIRTIDAEKVAAWKSNEINLYSVPFDELVMRLENTYNVHINYDHNKIDHLITTIHFSNYNTLQYVLEIIKTIHHLDYVLKGKEVYLKKE
ncbi:FecR family protein [Mucilaginibacter pocheonensis]|uniref:Ferric-dicitrate binding protein FerR (Iron transport regulator) n=1 Tax=Mucilaginibacter pocheonensis TaxID=398050 RepID=A0ABU1T790_9SPHI|nr:FecR domain-containing protein [Mucilaginibacter pocheonensis]MDR6941149.1 ferric-dicitrate binding protein FerR (iron transport regulator) [Mucilaginibacter pocheonensis]